MQLNISSRSRSYGCYMQTGQLGAPSLYTAKNAGPGRKLSASRGSQSSDEQLHVNIDCTSMHEAKVSPLQILANCSPEWTLTNAFEMIYVLNYIHVTNMYHTLHYTFFVLASTSIYSQFQYNTHQFIRVFASVLVPKMGSQSNVLLVSHIVIAYFETVFIGFVAELYNLSLCPFRAGQLHKCHVKL